MKALSPSNIRWSAIAAHLPGRTDNEIKNYWNTHIRKRLLRMGIDPVTHIPRLDLLDLSSLLSNPTLYSQAQYDVSRLLGIEPLMNSELLKFASGLLSSQCQDSNLAHLQNLQHEPLLNNSQVQDPFRSFQVPSCTTSSAQFCSESQLMQPNVAQFHSNADQANLWQANGMPCNFSENFVPATTSVGYDNLEQSVPQFVSDNSNFYLPNNQISYNMTTSVVSTSVSSPTMQLNSNSSTYINSSTEDERDSYSSDLFKFQIPDLLDVSEFM